MFGGDGRFHTRVEGRDFTPTEQRIIQGLLNVIFAEYEKAWKPVYEINFEYIRSEMNTQFANIATPSEIVVAITFTVELGGNSSEMHFCIPYSMIEPIRDILYSTMHSEQAGTDRRWTSMLVRQLQLAEVELVVPLASCEVPVSRIAELKVGDIIPIHIDEHIPAMVDGISVMDCRYGVRGGQYALKVERFLAQDEAEQA
jgi:flagellar motor switch protein FliM